MKRFNKTQWLLDSMPAGQWVSMDWGYRIMRASFGSCFTPPNALFKKLIDEGKVERRQITKNRSRQIIAEFKKKDVPHDTIDQ